MRKLYKLDSKGKVRILELSTEGSLFVQTSGLLDGKKVRHEKECKAKNVGKTNATTPEEQALAELDAKYKIKETEGYFRTQELAEAGEVLMPMLAKSFKEHGSKIGWDGYVFIQPKLDGIRALGKPKGDIISRKNRIIDTMPHIKESLSKLSTDNIFDGELYAHGLTFQENIKLIKKYRKGESENIKYHVYDLVLPDKSFAERYLLLKSLLEYGIIDFRLVPTFRIKNEKELSSFHSKFVHAGYEGSIVRWGDAGYKINGRSENLLKYKDFKDVACIIVDIEPAEQRPEWGVPVLEHNGKHFRAGTKMSHEERKQFLINKQDYIGKMAEIRYFEETDEGIPRFPVYYGIRLDK